MEYKQFEEVVRHNWFKFVRKFKIQRDLDEIEDVIQDVWLSIFKRNQTQQKVIKNLQTYINVCLKNREIRLRREYKRWIEIEKICEELSYESLPNIKEYIHWERYALIEQKLIELKMGGYTNWEAGVFLNLTERQVEYLMAKLKPKIKKDL